jgi:spermidine synthase
VRRFRPRPHNRPSGANRVRGAPILEFTVIVSGAVLLALEIVASRVIAPHLGNSIYVWGSLIGVFLAALAGGYFLGGVLADRRPSRSAFAGVVFVAGALVAPVPVLAPLVLDRAIASGMGSRGSPLLATLLLFFLPAVVMGMISPFAVRLRARSVATIGNVAGVLYALSTMGGIGGTLLAAFALIGVMSVEGIVYLLGAVEMALGVLLWAAARRAPAAVASGILAVVLVVGLPFASGREPPQGLRFQRDTVYHRITVNDEAGVRFLKLDAYWQSGIDLADPRRTVFAYSDYLHMPLIFTPQARRVLFVGLGGGTTPKRYYEDYPQMTIDVVEIDPAVVAVAREFFHVPDNARLRLFAQDGRLFVARSTQRYDIIILDAYLIDTIPFHLATREFFEAVRAHLVPGGVLASNIIGALDGPRSGFFRAVYKTLREVFPSVYVFPVDWGRYGGEEGLRNIIVVGAGTAPLSAEDIRFAAARARGVAGVSLPRFTEAAADLYTSPIRTGDVPVLTDDFAPVEILVQER